MPFRSSRFIGEPTLEACLAGQHRMYSGAKGAAVNAVQQALSDLGYLPATEVTGVYSAITRASVTRYKIAHGLSPSDPVVGPGTMKALDADIVAADAGNAPNAPPATPASSTRMQGKFIYGGAGSTIPLVNFGLSVSVFSMWLRSENGEFRGYTTASNQGLLGAAILETPIVDFTVADSGKFGALHGSIVDVTISSSIFLRSGGIAGIQVTVRHNDGPSDQFSFNASGVKGYSAVGGDIHFTAELMVLAGNDSNPNNARFLPF